MVVQESGQTGPIMYAVPVRYTYDERLREDYSVHISVKYKLCLDLAMNNRDCHLFAQ